MRCGRAETRTLQLCGRTQTGGVLKEDCKDRKDREDREDFKVRQGSSILTMKYHD